MARTYSLFIAAVLTGIALLAGVAAAGDVNISVGWPPPLIIEKPRVVMVPETQVYRAPQLEFNLFVFDGGVSPDRAVKGGPERSARTW